MPSTKNPARSGQDSGFGCQRLTKQHHQRLHNILISLNRFWFEVFAIKRNIVYFNFCNFFTSISGYLITTGKATLLSIQDFHLIKINNCIRFYQIPFREAFNRISTYEIRIIDCTKYDYTLICSIFGRIIKVFDEFC